MGAAKALIMDAAWSTLSATVEFDGNASKSADLKQARLTSVIVMGQSERTTCAGAARAAEIEHAGPGSPQRPGECASCSTHAASNAVYAGIAVDARDGPLYQ